MKCCICNKKIKAKEPKSYYRHGKRKVYSCKSCNQSGKFDQYIDSLPQEEENVS